jgi:hypothetical protein
VACRSFCRLILRPTFFARSKAGNTPSAASDLTFLQQQ